MGIIPAGPFLRVVSGSGGAVNVCDKPAGPLVSATDCHTVANLLYWYQADKGIVAAEGAKFSPWSGQGGTPNATQATVAERPIYKHRYSSNIPTVHFEEVDESNGSSFFNLSGSRARSSLTVYFACRVARLWVPAYSPFTSTSGLLLSAQSTHGGIILASRFDPGGGQNAISTHIQASKGLALTPYTLDVPAVCGWQVLCGVWDAPNSLMSIYRNGILLGSTAYAIDAGQTDTTWRIGEGPASNNNFSGEIVEIQTYYPVAHNAALVASTSSCIKGRWNLPQ